MCPDPVHYLSPVVSISIFSAPEECVLFIGLHYTRLGLAEPLQSGPNRALNETVNISNMERKGSTWWSESDQTPGVKFH